MTITLNSQTIIIKNLIHDSLLLYNEISSKGFDGRLFLVRAWPLTLGI